MILEAALITVSCVLFVQMGLADAIQDTLQCHLRIASCPKCLTMWTNLAYFLFTGHGFLLSVATSFIASYTALWLALVCDALSLLYNYLYDTITTETDADATPAEADQPAPPGDAPSVSEMPEMK